MKSNIYLFTATLLMSILLFTYSPKTTETQNLDPILDPIPLEIGLVQDEEKDLELYSLDAFRNTSISFVKANQNYDFVLYEVTGNGDFEGLKTALTEHLKRQNCDKDVLIFVLDECNPERVKQII